MTEPTPESDSPARASLKALLAKHPTNTKLKGDNRSALRKFKKLIPEPSENIYKFIHIDPSMSIPVEFEGKTVWKGLLSDVVDQKECGSCWAFASVTVLADRFNLFSLGKLHLNLSPVPIVLCDTHGAHNPEPLNDLETSVQLYEGVQKLYGCNGNLISEAWRMLYTVGTNEQSCMPLDLLKFRSPSSCIKLTGPAGDMCADYRYNFRSNTEYGTPAKFYTAYHVYAVPGTPEEKRSDLDICREIYKFGPVSTAFEVFEDFYRFDPKTTVYQSTQEGDRVAGHAVVLDGWGVQDGVKFWWVRNTWGPDWGIDGYFKMLRGVNHCKIEENVVTGIPDLSSTHYVIPEDIFQNAIIPRDVNQKFRIHSFENQAGGIDPNTGYSRRIMSYLDLRTSVQPTVERLKVPIPDYPTFIAAQVPSTIENARVASVQSSKSGSVPPPSPKWTRWIPAAAVLGTVILLVINGHVLRRRR
jgi:cathepsin B